MPQSEENFETRNKPRNRKKSRIFKLSLGSLEKIFKKGQTFSQKINAIKPFFPAISVLAKCRCAKYVCIGMMTVSSTSHMGSRQGCMSLQQQKPSRSRLFGEREDNSKFLLESLN